MNPALEAAFRLSTSLPSRVHYRQEPPIAITRAGNGKPITINGIYYESMAEASEILRISYKMLCKLRDTSPICPLKGLLGFNEEPLVSVDFNHNSSSAIFDTVGTKVMGKLVKILAWYDNEWGFSNRMLDVAAAWMKVK